MAKKKNRSPRASSGKSRVTAAKRAISRIKKKIARFKKYKEEGRVGTPQNKKNKSKAGGWRSKRHGWDTSGLEKELARQEDLLKRGPKIHTPKK